MGTFHMDGEVKRTLAHLNDLICAWKRVTGRGCTVVLVPHNSDEHFTVSVDGDPSPLTPHEALASAIAQRRGISAEENDRKAEGYVERKCVLCQRSVYFYNNLYHDDVPHQGRCVQVARLTDGEDQKIVCDECCHAIQEAARNYRSRW